MSRYIDADALLEILPSIEDEYKFCRKIISEQPAADVVEVVRCKDCKYRKFIDWGMGDCVHPKGSKHIAYDYHYCSYGERREDVRKSN